MEALHSSESLKNSEATGLENEQLAPPIAKIMGSCTIPDSATSKNRLFAFKGFGMISQEKRVAQTSAAFTHICDELIQREDQHRTTQARQKVTRVNPCGREKMLFWRLALIIDRTMCLS